MSKKTKMPPGADEATIRQLIENFEEGDLVGFSELESALGLFAASENGTAKEKAAAEILPWFHEAGNFHSQAAFVDEIGNLLTDAGEEELSPEAVTTRLQALLISPGPETPETEEALVVTEDWFEALIDDTEMLKKFVSEINEHMENVQVALLDLEYDPGNKEYINTVFRGFHTIKSSAAFLGVKNLEETAHYLENMLVLVRDGEIAVTPELIDVVFYGVSFIKDLADVFETVRYDRDKIIQSFLKIDIRPIIRITRKIAKEHRKKKIGQILQDLGKIDAKTVQKILHRQKEENRLFGDIALEEKAVEEKDIEEAVKEQSASKRELAYVKVAYDRLNDLVDMVGELVVNQSMIREEVSLGRQIQERELHQLEQITTNIKNIVLSMGMVPIGEVFNKLRVVIRNASRDTGKIVTTNITGEDTELDRTLIEAIIDPLVHIVRNAVDHGLDDVEEREAAGKNRVGEISISAEHKGSGIEIIVKDDGSGINREAVVNKAVEKKLIRPDEADRYRDDEKLCYSLLFKPGFSTAQKVTELSGRGVGLDVVRMNLERVHGRVDIESTPGEGTSFILKLPLTLAIIDGFVTRVGEERYIFSFNLIREIVVPTAENTRIMEDGEVILFNRDRHIPVIFTEQLITGVPVSRKPGEYVILIISYENGLYGIAVDQVIGKQEIVIKSLNEVLRDMNLFSGGTIFGDGTIGFVVDIDEFMRKAQA